MRRRRREPAVEAVDEQALVRRYRDLRRILMTCDPPSDKSKAIRAKADRLDASGAPLVECLASLEQFIAELGLAEVAERHLEMLAAIRRRL